MNADGWKVRYLIELTVIAFSLVAVELELGYVAACIVRTNITYIAEATRDSNVGIAHHILRALAGYEIKGNRIEKVRAVAAFEDSELNARFLTCTRAPANSCNDVRRAQIKTDPSARAVHRGIESRETAIESVGRRIDR